VRWRRAGESEGEGEGGEWWEEEGGGGRGGGGKQGLICGGRVDWEEKHSTVVRRREGGAGKELDKEDGVRELKGWWSVGGWV